MAMPRFYQISLRTILELVFVAAVVMGFFYWRNVPHNQPGRYQIEAIDNGQVLYLDTATGKLWRVRRSELDAFLESGATIGGAR